MSRGLEYPSFMGLMLFTVITVYRALPYFLTIWALEPRGCLIFIPNVGKFKGVFGVVSASRNIFLIEKNIYLDIDFKCFVIF